MREKIWLFAGGLIFWNVTLVFSITLQEAQQSLFNHNGSLLQLSHGIREKQARLDETRASLQPSLDLFASYSYISEKAKTSLGAMVIETGTNNRFESGVDLSYPLFTGFYRLNAIAADQQALKVVKEQLSSQKNLLSFQLGIYYFQWFSLSRQTEYSQQLIDQLTSHARQITNLKSVGSVTSTSLLKLNAKLSQAQVNLAHTRFAADSIMVLTSQLIGTSDTTEQPEPYSFPIVDFVSDTMNKSRHELCSINYSREQLIALQRATKGQLMPMIAANAGLRYSNPGLNMGSDDFMGYALAGVTVKWNIYNGFANKNKRRQIDEKIASMDQLEADLNLQWENQIRLCRRQLVLLDAQSESTRQSVEATDAALRDLKRMLDAGSITSQEYIDGLTDAVQSRISQDQLEYMKNILLLQLQFALGKEINF